MADKRDYYEVLGVSKDADDTALKKAYRVLAKKYHPDANPGDKDAEAKFKEASEAYAVLSDPEKRKRYDQFGHAAFDPSQGGYGGPQDFDMDDIMSMFGGMFGDFFGGSSRRSYSSTAPYKGANIQTSIRITFDEAMKGVEKEIEVNVKEECSTCHGTGGKPGSAKTTCTKCNGTGHIRIQKRTLFGIMESNEQCSQCKGAGSYYKEKCASCYGTGYQTVRKKIAVKIPAGVDSGNKVAIGGLGEPGGNGGPRGDLYVVVNVSSHPVFEREDLNIFSTVPISFATAALGATIKIQTIDGYVDYDVKPGTQPNTKLRLRGKGVPYYKNPQVRGDQYVTLRVVVPEKLTKEQKDALVEFDKAMNGGTSQVEENTKKKKGLFK